MGSTQLLSSREPATPATSRCSRESMKDLLKLNRSPPSSSSVPSRRPKVKLKVALDAIRLTMGGSHAPSSSRCCHTSLPRRRGWLSRSARSWTRIPAMLPATSTSTRPQRRACFSSTGPAEKMADQILAERAKAPSPVPRTWQPGFGLSPTWFKVKRSSSRILRRDHAEAPRTTARDEPAAVLPVRAGAAQTVKPRRTGRVARALTVLRCRFSRAALSRRSGGPRTQAPGTASASASPRAAVACAGRGRRPRRGGHAPGRARRGLARAAAPR